MNPPLIRKMFKERLESNEEKYCCQWEKGEKMSLFSINVVGPLQEPRDNPNE